jgi:branched-chain amino acid transport system ATP-binding protein
MTALLEARGVSAGYNDVPVVHDLSVQVAAGEILAILGPNGVGKTTAIMTLAGALEPIAGEVAWEGVPTTASLHRRARMGMALLTEQRAVIMGLTTRENLQLGAADPDTALEIFPELKARLSIRAGSLSGGEQQMLALGRCLSTQPKLLLADELSLGLAPLVVERLLGALHDATHRGVAVVLVEQVVDKALKVADRCVVLVRGRVRLQCPASELRGDLDRLHGLYFASEN